MISQLIDYTFEIKLVATLFAILISYNIIDHYFVILLSRASLASFNSSLDCCLGKRNLKLLIWTLVNCDDDLLFDILET